MHSKFRSIRENLFQRAIYYTEIYRPILRWFSATKKKTDTIELSASGYNQIYTASEHLQKIQIP